MFNIVGFGSGHQTLFPASVEYDAQSFKTASDHVSEMSGTTLNSINFNLMTLSANMGGTEILAPLRAILSTKSNPDYPRQIFLLTDGEVSNTQQIIEYASTNAKDTRIFTFGIGVDASPALVSGLAKVSRGEV